MAKKGKLIVIDGADGSGKATQTKLLVARLNKAGYRVKTLDFPRYESNFFGKFIGECLGGKHGDFLALSPYIASIVYDIDRWESRVELVRALEQGFVVVLDRYVSANQIHQGSKIQNTRKRKQFLAWLEQMDFEIFKLPRPDLTLYLNVPYSVSRGLLKQKGNRLKKVYLGKGKQDQAEGSELHQELSRKYALELISQKKHFLKVDCFEKQTFLSPETIHEKIWKTIEPIL